MLSDHLEKLTVVKAIAELGSLRRASESLGIAQPSLTRTIKILEETLGAKLFQRSIRGMQLTREGAILLDFAESTLNRADDVSRRIKFATDENAGCLTIGTFESLSIYLWPQLISGLKKSLPHLQIKLKTNQDGDHLEHLASGRFDLVVDAEPRPRDNMISVTLYSDRFNFYCSSALASKLPKQISVKDTKEIPFIYVDAAFDEHDKKISDHLRAAGYAGATSFEIDSFETAKALAAEGVGIAVLPERVAEAANAGARLKNIQLSGLPATGFGRHKICVTYMADNRSDPRIKAATQEMKRLLKVD
jgi:DNA-binding transcriptional LysR family regulator